MDGGQLNARHWTLAGNGPYGLYVDTGSAEIANTIAASHTTAAFWGTVSADHTLFAGNGTDCGDSATCTNNLSGLPLFADPSEADYHLLIGSAAIDAGKDAGVTTDIDGDSRPLCYGYDVGGRTNLVLRQVVRRRHQRPPPRLRRPTRQRQLRQLR